MSAPTTLETGAAYIRVSTDDQTELSPDAQLRVILEAAKADGFIIPKEFVFIEKKGISGRRADNRPDFQRMIALAKSQKPAPFRRLYLWKFSRFARNQDESTFYKSVLRKKCGVDIKSVSEPIAEGMFGRLIESIIEWFDEYYSYNLSGEVIRGMTEKALRSGYQATPSLGYAAVGAGKPFVIEEKAYAIAEFIFQTYYNGKDMTATAREANARGYRTRRGNRFDRRGVYRTLTNRFYIGEVVWNGIAFQGTHETRPSITSIFEDVQKRIEAEYRPQKRREVSANAHWLSGLLTCSVCGGSLGYNRSNDPKKRPDFFQCWKYAKGMHPGSCCLSVRLAEKAVIEGLEKVLDTDELEYEYIRKIDDTVNAEEIAVKEALARLEIKERRIKEAYENEIDTLEEYRQNKLRLKAEREDLMADADRIRRKAQQSPEVIPSKGEVLRQIAHAHDIIADPNMDNETKGNALRKVVKDIVFDRSKGHLYINYYIS